MNTLICKTDTKPAELGTRPFRIVMRLNAGNQITPYVVHMETDPDTDGNAYCYGDYCRDQMEAFEAYVRKCQRHGLIPLDALGNRIQKLSV